MAGKALGGAPSDDWDDDPVLQRIAVVLDHYGITEEAIRGRIAKYRDRGQYLKFQMVAQVYRAPTMAAIAELIHEAALRRYVALPAPEPLGPVWLTAYQVARLAFGYRSARRFLRNIPPDFPPRDPVTCQWSLEAVKAWMAAQQSPQVTQLSRGSSAQVQMVNEAHMIDLQRGLPQGKSK